MDINNGLLSLTLNKDKLVILNLQNNESFELDWPGTAVSIQGRRIIPEKVVSAPEVTKKTISQKFVASNLEFTVSATLSENCWFNKKVEVKKNAEFPVVDYIDVDIQQDINDELELCGYCASSQPISMEPQAEEEASGRMPGCGYPLIGNKYFVGLEHPAGFNIVDKNEEGAPLYYLRHYPQWEGNTLESIDAVFGWSEDPHTSFFEYLDTIRLPILNKPLISFCTFWSDPYVGNYEYAVHYDNYMSFFKAFERLGLNPDVFTLDAGWNDRQSFFDAKEEVGGYEGLKRIRDFIRRNGSELSLWVSHNGPMGIAPDFLRKNDIEVGGGMAAAYCIGEYGVMLDEKLEKDLAQSFTKLTGDLGAIHFKIDWDNECATNPTFNENYPTAHHVRQGSVNAMNRIAARMREVNPAVAIRNGWWVSPWWLSHVSHVWLCQSGDSEFSSLPSKNQRDSASTHRDAMYYNVLQRDKTALPLDCFDNHEFPDALRNPFTADPASWTNAVWLSFLRGSTYLAYTLQPEKLEDWQVESFKQIIDFCRVNSKNIFVKHGKMTGGHSGRGDIYGFLQTGETQSWLLLRNPLPIPQEFSLDTQELALPHDICSLLQFYPVYELLDSSEKMTFTAHEVKIIILDSKTVESPYEVPFIARSSSEGVEHFFPSSINMTEEIRPLVDEIYQIPELKVSELSKKITTESVVLYFKATAPYRTHELELQVKVSGPDAIKSRMQVNFSRYPKAEGSAYSLPVTEITSSMPGFGEFRNIEDVASADQKFYAVKIPDGGESYYRVEIFGVDLQVDELELWLAGYEAPSRECVRTKVAPFGFNKSIPYQHPLGFPRAVRINF